MTMKSSNDWNAAEDQTRPGRMPPWLGRVRRGLLHVSSRLKSVAGVFIAIVAFQLALAAFSIELLSSVRAYVAGESLYSKGQKDALLRLQAYVQSHRDADYLGFTQALAVPEGDARARRALQQQPPDRAAAREGFLAGQNDADDIAGLIRLFVLAHKVPFMARAIQIWTQGDAAIAELRGLVDAARQSILAGDSQAPAVQRLETLMPDRNARLTTLERDFSEELGRASRLVRGLLLGLNLSMSTLLAIVGSRFIRNTLRAQRHREAELAGLLNAMGEAVITVDSEHKVVLFNRAAELIFGTANVEALGSQVDRFISEDLSIALESPDAARTDSLHELTGMHADGHPLHLEVSVTQLRTSRGLRTTIVCRDVTKQRKVRERERTQLMRRTMELTRKAFTDALTGLPNREALAHHLEDTLATASKDDNALFVLFLDLDGFKAV
ncbi:MAG: PAS domain S-box protein, partial [Paucibacter sp.]|nr:PAS domain S-box protein [Roseateles sp.]